MADLHIEFDSLMGLADALQRIEDQAYQAVMVDMDRQLRQSLASWTGAAQQEYETARAGWTQTFQELTAALAMARKHVRDTNDAYQTAEASNISMWRSR